jgi:Fe-Mn family superoxide dismutase
MQFEVPELPYPHAALEPIIDTATMQIHHGKHHAKYVNKLNAAIDGLDVPNNIQSLIRELEQIPEDRRTAVRNNGGGHANHSLFWEIMTSPEQRTYISDDLNDALSQHFGGFEPFREQFTEAAKTRFGSGWAWLCVADNGDLFVCSTPNQDNPQMKGFVDRTGIPILGLDVWEHAYYLKYQNRRPDYIAAWWDVVNWERVSENYAACRTVVAGT